MDTVANVSADVRQIHEDGIAQVLESLLAVVVLSGNDALYADRQRTVPCGDSGQDGELCMGRAWPKSRFEGVGDTLIDHLTHLCWRRKADLAERQVTWGDAFAAIRKLNEESKETGWRLPNINELESLVDGSMHHPALPAEHVFTHVREAYWSSTTSIFEPDWAWGLYLSKGAVGVGEKKGAHFHVWAVCDAPGYSNPCPRIQVFTHCGGERSSLDERVSEGGRKPWIRTSPRKKGME